MDDLHYTLYSLLQQSFVPDGILLWLASEQFPEREKSLPEKVLALRKAGISILWCENLHSYKKLVPAIRRYPKDVIVTADDDLFYHRHWLRNLYADHLKSPTCVIGHRLHRISFDENGAIAPYKEWTKNIKSLQPSFLNLATTGSGALFPPGSLHSDVLSSESFLKLAPSADDIWFWAMAVLNGTRIKLAKYAIRRLIYTNLEREFGNAAHRLSAGNLNGGNDIQLKALCGAYPQILKILDREEAFS